MARLLGAFTPRALVQVLSFKPHRAESFIIRRNKRSGISDGKGGKTNDVGTLGLEESKAAVRKSKDQKDSNHSKTKQGSVAVKQGIANSSG